MHLKSLKIYCDVVGRRSFSRAAEENDISQSGVSQVIHQLEERLGSQLIDRSKRPFMLTPEGQTFYDGCRKIVQNYFDLEERIRSLHEDIAGRVVVASIYSVGLHDMSRCMQEFMRQYPKAKVRLEYLHPNLVYEAVGAPSDCHICRVHRCRSSNHSHAGVPWHRKRHWRCS